MVSTPLHASTWTPLNEGVASFGVDGDADGQPMSALKYRPFERVRRALITDTGDSLLSTRSVRAAACGVVRR